MFRSARSYMPAVDYVSIVRSVYSDREALLFGAAAGAIAAGLSAHRTGSMYFVVIAAAILVVGILRYILSHSFWSADIADDDAESAQYWENWATLGGASVVVVYGAWCFVSLVVVDDGYSEMISIALSIAGLVGIVARNFGLDRLVTLQIGILCSLCGAGLIFSGDVYHLGAAALLLIMMLSFRKLAGDTRTLLLNVVHGRVKADKLAGELDTALSTMPHGLCMFDANGRITVINEQTQHRFLGASASSFVGCTIDDLLKSALHNGTITKAVRDCLLAEIDQRGQSKMVIHMNDGRHCEVTIAHQNDNSVLMFEDVTERVRSQERISHMARYDGLTQIPNRSFFTEQVQARLSEMVGTDNDDIVMMMIIDVDDFKHVNDTYGHPVGDNLIVEVARRIRQVVGPDVLVSRFGGDEFMVFRAGINADEAEEEAQALLGALRVNFELGTEEVSVTASIGVVLENADKADIDTLLKRSDLALYKAKGNGKARWCLFHDLMDIEYKQRQRLKLELMDALNAGQLFLHYQPIIDLHTRHIIGCEALIRWVHPELGNIPPMQFIPIAEEIGGMSDISRFVLETATRECRNWPEHMTVSVNLSATDFRAVNVQEMVLDALEQTGLAPERLIVEITETALIEEREKAAQALAGLRTKGIGVALDDFGTGYSSLSYLHAMSFSKLKIDRSFVVDVTTNDRALRLMNNIARLSRDLEMTVTVEGIETQEQLDLIASAGLIDHAQGYLFGVPLPAKDILEVILRATPEKASRNQNGRARKKAVGGSV